MNLKNLKQLAIKAAKEAGEYLLKNKTAKKEIFSEQGRDIKLEIDRSTEKLIRASLRESDISILGEEYGGKSSDGLVWVIDPIDGTKAFVSGLPFFGTMIGLIKNSKPILGLIDQPITKDRIWGGPKGSYLNNKKVKTRSFESINKTICAITDPAMFIENDKDKAIYDMIVDKTLYVKHGTDCWGYAMCAGGTIDLVIEKDLEIWDIVAARAIIEAAGGIVTAWNKSEAASDRSVIAAANIETYNFFTEIIDKL